MKKIFYYSIIFITTISCRESEINFKEESTNIQIEVPEVLIPDNSEDDPEQMGISCSGEFIYKQRGNSGGLIDPIDIPVDLPENMDLSDDIPPVKSQGNQGSCVAWATTYYLKSYQEKKQKEYEYQTYENVMSPAFIYNQIKFNNDCGSGSMIEDALFLLSTVGTTSWEEFPYSDLYCSNIPTEDQVKVAAQNKIKDYYYLGIPEDNINEDYTMINLIKTLIYQTNPIIISMDFKNLVFTTESGRFLATSYSLTPEDSCGHAILIVGYDDDIEAFKIVNSWGTDWGDYGYAWISYNFFEKEESVNYQRGFNGAYIAYDDIE